MRGTSRQYLVAIRAMIVFTILLGLAYPLLITGIGQTLFPTQANGSTTTNNGEIVGSTLIGQTFTDPDGNPLPEWFQPRPSAAGDGYDAAASSGSNLGPNNDDLLTAITERRTTIENLDNTQTIPPDALTTSGSGLDPHISPEYAQLQTTRIAQTRGIDKTQLTQLVTSMIQGRDIGYLGEPRINVLQLNIALTKLQ